MTEDARLPCMQPRDLFSIGHAATALTVLEK